MSRVDRSLLAIFSAEQAEHLTSMRTRLEDLRGEDPGRRAASVDDLLRRMHSLKGAARAVGLDQTEMLTHQSEEVLGKVRDGASESLEAVVRALSRMADAIEDVLAAEIAERAVPDCSDVLRQLVQLSGPSAEVRGTPPQPSTAAERDNGASAATDLLRIHASSLDDLIRSTSELLIDATAEVGPARFEEYVARLEETAEDWVRLRRSSASSVRELAAAPEFRAVETCLSFMDTRLAALRRDARRLNEDLGFASRSTRTKAGAVHHTACRIRMTPAESVFAALGPMVREIAQREGREVIFETAGLDTNADLLVLQGLKDPVLHLLRNAVSHGIETPAERARAGKAREGMIRLVLSSRGDRLELVVEDDGRGIDYAAVEREARARGLLGVDENEAHEDDIGRLIFRAGFSTSKAVTEVSGRGMGLSIVESGVRRLHGGIGLYPRPDGGTRVVISAPMTISTQHVLLLSVGGHLFGIATAYVERVLRVAPSEVRNVSGRESIATASGSVALRPLASVLGLPRAKEREDNIFACALLNLNGRRMAFAADRLVDEREATIKDTGLQDAVAGLTAGAIPMEDGTVAVMLNVNALFEMAGRTRRAATVASAPAAKPARRRRILVVDDSLTTRSLEKSILEANGYAVTLAVDGVEAFERLRIDLPDLVISDVSMPRMTGFQLLEQMKKDDKMKKIPFILVTSLESLEEQQLGLSLGADAYIIKRKFDQRELLNVIREML